MKLLVSIVLTGEPKSKARPRVGFGRGYTPQTTRTAETDIGWQLRTVIRRPNETDDLAVTLRFFSGTRRRTDLDNLVKLVLDACNGIVWRDDSQVVQLHAQLERGAARARTELEVHVIDQQKAAAA